MSLLADVRRVVAERIEDASIDSSANIYAYPPKAPSLPAVLVLPSPDTYIAYHGTYGANGVVEINLIVRIVVAEKQSAASAAELLDSFLSTGAAEDISLADAITGNEVEIGDGIGTIYVGDAVGWTIGNLGTEVAPIPALSCDLPVAVRIKRST